MKKPFQHETVLLQELIEAMDIKSGDTVVDCTAGGGGHLKLALAAVGILGKVLAIDQDQVALTHLRERFAAEIDAGNLILHYGRFDQLGDIIKQYPGISSITAIYADIGVSSPQLDERERGFSFQHDAPLDMRMNQSSDDETAADLIANSSLDELRSIIRNYGEDPKAHEIAKAILRARESAPILRTVQLADIVKKAVHYLKPSRVHPATRTFQALRIAVNRELDALDSLLKQGCELLAVNGRLGIISFHSLEDRMVKHYMQTLAGKRQDPNQPRLRHLAVQETNVANYSIIKPFPLEPSVEECERNPRSRSAKLRVIEKLHIG